MERGHPVFHLEPLGNVGMIADDQIRAEFDAQVFIAPLEVGTLGLILAPRVNRGDDNLAAGFLAGIKAGLELLLVLDLFGGVAAVVTGIGAHETDFDLSEVGNPVAVEPEGGAAVSDPLGFQGCHRFFDALVAVILRMVIGQIYHFHTAFGENLRIVRGGPEDIMGLGESLFDIIRQDAFQIHKSDVIL